MIPLFALMTGLSLCDIKRKIIPNWVVLPAIVYGLLAYRLYLPTLTMFALMLIIYKQQVWHGGDVKLSVMVTAFVGWWAFAIIGLTFLLIRFWRAHRGYYYALPVAPFMFIATLVTCGILRGWPL